MAEGVERFAFTPADELGPSMPVVMSNGDWVRYSDYEKLGDELDKAEAAADEFECQRDQARQEVLEEAGKWLEGCVATLDARPGDQDDEGLAKLALLSDLRDFLATLDPSGELDDEWPFDDDPPDPL